MKSTFKKLSGSLVDLDVVLDQKEFQEYYQTVFDQAVAKVQLKGFRPGAAPRELAEKAVDRDRVFQEAAHNAIRFSLDEAIKENNWTLIDSPKIEIQESPDLSFKYHATLTVFPEIKLGNYKKIAKKVWAEKKAVTVETPEVEKTLAWLRNSRAKITKVNREAHRGDLIDIDVSSAIDSFKGDRFVLGEGKFLPGFEERLENHKAGENLEFSLTAPADYWNEKIRGQNINFQVKINDVFERQLPELDDNFAQGLGPNFKTVDDLKKNINEGMTMEKNKKEEERLKIKILDEIIKSSELNIPSIMLEKTLNKMVKDMEPMMKNSGKGEAEIREQLRDRARNNVAGNLVIYKIAQAEHLEPSQEELKAEASSQHLDLEKFYDYIYGVVLNRKVWTNLINI